MRPIIKIVFAVAFSALLAACSSAPRKQINPPRASIQELAVQPDGQWRLTVRLQNFSNVVTAFQSVDARLTVADQAAGAVALSPAISIGPESADVVSATLRPTLAAKLIVASALSGGQPVRYALTGRIVTADPKGSYDFSFESTLNPAPGLNGVLR